MSQGRAAPPRDSSEGDTRDLARGAGVNYLGSIARIAPRAAFLVLAGRWYGQEAFGAYTFATALVETAAAMSLFGMKRSLFRFMSEGKARGEGVASAIAHGAALALTMGTLATLVVVFGVGTFTARLPQALEPLLVLSLAIPLIVLSDILLISIRFTRQMRFEVFARSLIEPITLTAALVVVHIAGADRLGLAWAYVISLAAAALASVVFFTRVFDLGAVLRARLRWRDARALASFSGPTAGYESLLMLADKADIFVVSYFLPAGSVGVYGMARQLATITKKIRAGFDRILPPVFAEAVAADDMSWADRQLAMVARWILTAELLVALVFVFYGDAILWAIEPAFVVGHGVLVLMMVGDAFNGSLGVSELPFVYLRPWWNVWFGAALLALVTGLGAGLVPAFGLAGAAAAVLLAVLAVNAARIAASRAVLAMKVVGADVAKPLIAAGAAAGAGFTAHWLLTPVPWAARLAALPLVCGVYFGTLWMLGLEPEDRAQVARMTAKFSRGRAPATP
ncbi:MAG: hypothetical protein D6701_03610 [Gemmatimonadetes bacterium]|nr:MAG: hypothetical protein D6701_03610 [Gemmatimonadota bacterium]